MFTKEQANTIILQLGGWNRIEALVGGEFLSYSEEHNCISFRFKMNPKINHVKIIYNANDTYTMKFGQLRKSKGIMGFKEVEVIEDVYNDNLKSIFEETTGLYLSL